MNLIKRASEIKIHGNLALLEHQIKRFDTHFAFIKVCAIAAVTDIGWAKDGLFTGMDNAENFRFLWRKCSERVKWTFDFEVDFIKHGLIFTSFRGYYSTTR